VDEIFSLGIARKAQPLERLRRRHAEFQKRVITLSPNEDQSSGSVFSIRTSSDELPTIRKPLMARPISSIVQSNTTQQQFSPSSSRPIKSNTTKKNTKMEIFCDDDDDNSGANGGYGGVHVLPTSESANPWPEYGSEKDRRKENVRQKEYWKAKPASIQGNSSRSNDSYKLEIFRDEVNLKNFFRKGKRDKK